MTPPTPLPSTMAVRDLFAMTVGRDVSMVVGGEPLTPATPGGVIVGEDVPDFGRPEALIAFDIPLAAHLGAALGLVPATASAVAIEDGYLPESLLDNTYEVLNIAASLFNTEGAPHLRLAAMHDSTETPLPAPVANWLRGYPPRLDAAAEVKEYGGGRVSVLIK